MLENWLTPLDKNIDQKSYEDWQLGHQIRMYQKDIPTLKDVQIAIVGLDESAAAIRESLYKMSFPFEGLNIADIGNTRKNNENFLIPLISELVRGKILPVLVGKEKSFIQAQYKAFLSLQKHISMVVVDDIIALSDLDENTETYYLNEIFHQKSASLFQLSCLAYQLQYTAPISRKLLHNKHYETVRLGTAKSSPKDLEPIVRYADLFCMQTDSFEWQLKPSKKRKNAAGINIDIACRLSRYAGISDKLKSFGIFGFDTQHPSHELTAETAAQVIWYLMDGYYHRKQDFPVTTQGLVEYIVDFKNEKISFWKSIKSGRWWMQLAVNTGNEEARHRLIPCSYEDYQKAAQGDLSDRLVYGLKRF